MKHILMTLALVATVCISACDNDKEMASGLDEKTLIADIQFTNIENGKLTLAASVDYTDSLVAYRFTPELPTNSKVKWDSSNEKVATVTQDGLVHAVSAGKVNIMVSPEIGFGATALFELTVVPEFKPIADFEFSDADKEDLFASDSRKLSPVVLPVDRTYSNVTWKSSDEAIATISKDGVLTGIVEGDVVITAVSQDRGGYKESFNLHIKPIIPIEKIEFGVQEELVIGERATLNFTTTPANATIASLKWKSDNEDAVTVNEQGVVTAENYGEAIITATTIGGVTYTTKVLVPYGLMKYSFDAILTPWYLRQADGYTSSASFGEGGALVKMVPNPAKGNACRADLVLTLNGSNKDKVYLNVGVYQYMAIKMIRPYGANKLQGNIKLDTNYGSYMENNGSGNNKYTILDGEETHGAVDVYYYDLQQVFGNVTNKPEHYFSTTEPEEAKTLQLVMADFKETNGCNTEYTVYWVRTFKTVDDLKAFVERENKN